MLSLTCGLVLTFVQMTNAANILLVPFGFHSHIAEIVSIGLELKIHHSHSLHMIMMRSYPGYNKLNHEDINIISYHQKEKDIYSLPPEEGFQEMFESSMTMTPIEDFRYNIKGGKENCVNLLSDDNLRKKLLHIRIDLAIVDAFPWNRCAYVLLYSLDIPYISLITQYEPCLFRLPALPSFVPFGLGAPYSEQMTFWERLQNTWNLVDWTAKTSQLPFLDNSFVTKYAPNKPYLSLNQLAHRSFLWLLDSDVIIDYPRPLMPNMIEIGGLTTKPAKALPDDLDAFMQNATNGVILVSFGSVSASLPKSVLHKLLNAFLATEHNILWGGTKIENQKLPDRIKFREWLPQNDILGHNKTKLFISHAGANSQFEALYHGVPMICLPVWADQPYNAKRFEHKGFGLSLNIFKSTSSDVVNSINILIKNKSFAQNIQKASFAFRSKLFSPKQWAAVWIEHILEHGGKHLQSYALEMPWYQYLLLDVIGFIFLIIFALTVIILLGFYCLIQQYFRQNVIEKKKDKIN